MAQFHLDSQAAEKWLQASETKDWQQEVQQAHDKVHQGTGRGNDFLGWLNPLDPNGEVVSQVLTAADKIRSNSDVLLVIGIGGSYAGARAGIEMLTDTFRNQLSKDKRQGPEIYFFGQNLSATYMKDVFAQIEGKDVSVNVISKSGTTTEPAVAFRLVREWMINKYGATEAGKRIYATTDKAKGALRGFAEAEGYTTFVIPDDIGGRYSVMTPVGLLPMAVAGIDIKELMSGAKEAADLYSNPNLAENSCYQYAANRNNLYRQGKKIELLVNYEPRLTIFAEWWKQLFGESEGKENKGIYPASVQFTTDLHSMGQYIQQGERHLFETVLWVEHSPADDELKIPQLEQDLDGLNYLAGKTVAHVNKQAFLATVQAHEDGGVPSLVVQIPELTARNVGHLFYFFEKACSISGYLLDVNPFDQPGVEAYKTNMFRLLGKPGAK